MEKELFNFIIDNHHHYPAEVQARISKHRSLSIATQSVVDPSRMILVTRWFYTHGPEYTFNYTDQAEYAKQEFLAKELAAAREVVMEALPPLEIDESFIKDTDRMMVGAEIYLRALSQRAAILNHYAGKIAGMDTYPVIRQAAERANQCLEKILTKAKAPSLGAESPDKIAA